MSDRLKHNNKLVDKLIKNDYINELIEEYREELNDYDYIDTVDKFSLLRLRGSIKYINKYDKKLRNGGLLIKIYQKESKWYCIIKKMEKKYYVSFDANYFFYLDNKDNLMRNWAESFINDYDKNNK